MSANAKRYVGGCLCGLLRYEAQGEPRAMGHCYCADCRKASGSGFIPFMEFPASALSFTGPTRQFTTKAASGRNAVRNSCPICGGLVFGGVIGEDTSHTIYAGSLDDPAAFQPQIAIFTRDRPAWATLPPGLRLFAGQPA